jgi:dTDP-4-amino-4,6-dideoxygalactose transaminase
VDIDPTTALMSVAALESKLKQAERDGTLPKVVLPVHLTGSSCAMAAIGALAERYGFAVLEDASHAIGGRYLGEPVGNCRHSAITVFSFHPVKIITTGEGGPGHYQRSAAGPAHGGTAQPRHRARGRAL